MLSSNSKSLASSNQQVISTVTGAMPSDAAGTKRGRAGVRLARWTGEEDQCLRHAVEQHGEQNWETVAAQLGHGRTASSVKQRYYAVILGRWKQKPDATAADAQHRRRVEPRRPQVDVEDELRRLRRGGRPRELLDGAPRRDRVVGALLRVEARGERADDDDLGLEGGAVELGRRRVSDVVP